MDLKTFQGLLAHVLAVHRYCLRRPRYEQPTWTVGEMVYHNRYETDRVYSVQEFLNRHAPHLSREQGIDLTMICIELVQRHGIQPKRIPEEIRGRFRL